MFTASNGHFLTHIPHPMQRTSEKKAILSSDVTCNDEITLYSVSSRPTRVSGKKLSY
jgi:hypothetical protein